MDIKNNPGIKSSFEDMATDEGRATALSEAQDIQLALETILEITNDKAEFDAAILLSKKINETISSLLKVNYNPKD